ncbi:MAG TPA: bleomycin resistance family protein [Pyrinomonadaceae bacterium]|nr:bleomycin resistance family protein [Pyrinomonadaceae bacterium]
MNAKALTPILNVSDFKESVAWFEKLGLEFSWAWGDEPTFGGICSGECQIFLCQDAQGGRGKGSNKMTFGEDGSETGDKGVWMSIWVGDVDTIYTRCLEQGLDVTFPPHDMEWNVREFHVRHPTGTSSASAAGSKRSDHALFIRRQIARWRWPPG